MPIIERDPWRQQYFEGVACPEDVIIPTDDEHAYELYPRHRWIYNKLAICETQGLPAAPHGVPPPGYPVFSKPIYNLSGMGVGGRVIHSAPEYQETLTAGHLWMPLLTGEHISSDVILVDGEARWWRHTEGKSLGEGVFDYWTIRAGPHPGIECEGGEWLARHLKGYTGAVNVETIGGRIIEVHLRFADQWPDLYGPGWLSSVVQLYTEHRWSYREGERRIGYSVVLFGPHGSCYRRPPAAVLARLSSRPGVSSIQITFHEDRPPAQHAMPPGGFRLAIVNCWNLRIGFEVREELTRWLRPG